MSELSPAERLVVSVDIEQGILEGGGTLHGNMVGHILPLVDILKDTKVVIKLNTALSLCGLALVNEIRERGLAVFADLKLFDTEDTLVRYGRTLAEYAPDILTVASVARIGRLVNMLPNTKIYGVSILTDMGEEEVEYLYGCTLPEAVVKLGRRALENGAHGLIASPLDVTVLRDVFGSDIDIITPGVRPNWYKEGSHNHTRVLSPYEAIQSGATRVVVGRPLSIVPPDFIGVKEKVLSIIEEIDSAMNEKISGGLPAPYIFS